MFFVVAVDFNDGCCPHPLLSPSIYQQQELLENLLSGLVLDRVESVLCCQGRETLDRDADEI